MLGKSIHVRVYEICIYISVKDDSLNIVTCICCFLVAARLHVLIFIIYQAYSIL